MRGKSVISKGGDAICLGSHTLACLASSKCLDRYFQTDCHYVDENREVPWLQAWKNGTNHGKMGKSAKKKWNQTWQNGEGEVHLATFTWHNEKNNTPQNRMYIAAIEK